MKLPQVWHRHAECNDVCEGVEWAKDHITQVQPNTVALGFYVPGYSNWSTLEHDKQALRYSATRNKATHSPGNDSKPLAWKYAKVQKQDRDLDCGDRGGHEHLGCKHQLQDATSISECSWNLLHKSVPTQILWDFWEELHSSRPHFERLSANHVVSGLAAWSSEGTYIADRPWPLP